MNDEQGVASPGGEITRAIELDERLLTSFCGQNDQRLDEIEQQMGIRIVTRGSMLKIIGEVEPVEKTEVLIRELLDVFEKGGRSLSLPQMRYAINNARENRGEDIRKIYGTHVEVQLKGRRIVPMTAGQKLYIEAIREHDIVFGLGPAGTGKTYLAMAMAVNALLAGDVRRIILVRPAVEAGEKIGFLPGDIAQKLDPFVRPLYDALYDMMEASKVVSYLESGIIEIAPLAFMRGRTLNEAFIILDEGQNSSVEQMKMFLTRIGFESKAVITGDTSQIDLERGRMSGLVHASNVLKGIDGIQVVRFDHKDIVRHPLVQRIVEAYGREEAEAMSRKEEARRES